MSNYRYIINKIEKAICLLVVSLITTVFSKPAIGFEKANLAPYVKDQYIESSIKEITLKQDLFPLEENQSLLVINRFKDQTIDTKINYSYDSKGRVVYRYRLSENIEDPHPACCKVSSETDYVQLTPYDGLIDTNKIKLSNKMVYFDGFNSTFVMNISYKQCIVAKYFYQKPYDSLHRYEFNEWTKRVKNYISNNNFVIDNN